MKAKLKKLFVIFILAIGAVVVWINYNSNVTRSDSFEDSGYVEITAPKGWCVEDEDTIDEMLSRDASQGTFGSNIYHQDCDDIELDENGVSKYVPFISFLPYNAIMNSRGEVMVKPADNALSQCNNKDISQLEVDSKAISYCQAKQQISPMLGETVYVAYEISENKAIGLKIHNDLWNTNQAEILEMIKSIKYVEAPK